MSTKKVILQLDKEKLSEYLGLEVMDETIKITLSIPDDKKNLKALVESRVISDWDYADDIVEQKPEPLPEEIRPLHGAGWENLVSIPDIASEHGILEAMGIEKNYNKIAWLVESVWGVAQKTPALRFNINTDPDSLLIVALKKEMSNTSISSEHTIIALLSESRYNIWDLPDIDKDLTERLQKSWQNMNGMSLTDLAKEIYER